MTRSARSLFAVLAFLTSFLTTVHGQGSTASMAGVVRDEQNLVVPGTAVTLAAIENRFSRSVTTDANGGFEFIPFIVGVVVAIILIAIYLAVTGKRGTRVR